MRSATAFGDSFVIQFNQSSSVNNINPRIMAGSSVSGGALSYLVVKSGVGPYRDFTCATPATTCRWGDYAAATPDPLPTTSGRGEVWSTNQFSGMLDPPDDSANWRTQIFAIQP